MLQNTLIEGVSYEIWQFEWGAGNNNGMRVAPGTAKVSFLNVCPK
jgi:hypothetical protein